jgi:hypothetical protein
MMQESQWSFWLRWVLANAAGEVVGLGTAFGVGVAAVSLLQGAGGFLPTLASAAAMLLGGCFEGLVVGVAQSWVLRRRMPELSRKAWIAATVAGAFIAWSFGTLAMTMMTFGADAADASPAEPPQALVLAMAAALGLAAGAILGGPQWWVLRRVVRRAGWWIAANGLAWFVGMPIVFIGADAIFAGGSVLHTVLVAALPLAGAGAAVGAVHGLVLLRLLANRSQ